MIKPMKSPMPVRVQPVVRRLNFPDWPQLREGMKLCDQELILKVQADLTLLASESGVEAQWISDNIVELVEEHLSKRGYSATLLRRILSPNTQVSEPPPQTP